MLLNQLKCTRTGF